MKFIHKIFFVQESLMIPRNMTHPSKIHKAPTCDPPSVPLSLFFSPSHGNGIRIHGICYTWKIYILDLFHKLLQLNCSYHKLHFRRMKHKRLSSTCTVYRKSLLLFFHVKMKNKTNYLVVILLDSFEVYNTFSDLNFITKFLNTFSSE